MVLLFFIPRSTPRIHNGGNDNASIAGFKWPKNPPEDNLLLWLWEEMGLLGSYYVKEPTIDLAKAKAMINWT